MIGGLNPLASTMFITRFIVSNSIIVHDYFFPVNCTYYAEEINELTKSDMSSMLHAKIYQQLRMSCQPPTSLYF
jgi:hypothetical protein